MDARTPDLEVEAKQRLREVEVEVNLHNASKDVMLSHDVHPSALFDTACPVCGRPHRLVAQWTGKEMHNDKTKHPPI